MNNKEKLERVKRRALIREQIKHNIINHILSEDDGGDYGYDGGVDGTTGGYTPSGGLDSFFESDFAKIFGISALNNMAKVAVGGARKIVAKTVGEAGILAKSLAFTLIPFIAPDAGNIIDMAKEDRAKIEQKLASISAEYADIIKKNDAIFSNLDFSLMAFIANPGLVVAGGLAKSSWTMAEKLYDSLVPNDPSRRAQTSSISQNMSALFKRLGIAPTPVDPEGLTAAFANGVAKPVAQAALQEQVAAVDPLAQLKAAIQANPTPEVMALIANIKKGVDASKAYIQSPLAAANIEKNPAVQAGRQVLVSEVVNAAKKTFDLMTFENLKSKYAAQIDKYFKSQGVEDEKLKEQMMAAPDFKKSLVLTLKSTFMKPYVAQLDALLKLNPTGMASSVTEAKKTLASMAAAVN